MVILGIGHTTVCAWNINTTSPILLTHHSNRHHLHGATKIRTYIILPDQARECKSGGIAKQMARPSVLNSELPKIEYLTPFQQTENIFIWMWNGVRMDMLQPLKHTPRNTWLQSQTISVKHALDIHQVHLYGVIHLFQVIFPQLLPSQKWAKNH